MLDFRCLHLNPSPPFLSLRAIPDRSRGGAAISLSQPHPLNPPLKLFHGVRAKVFLFERGKQKRGVSPLLNVLLEVAVQ